MLVAVDRNDEGEVQRVKAELFLDGVPQRLVLSFAAVKHSLDVFEPAPRVLDHVSDESARIQSCGWNKVSCEEMTFDWLRNRLTQLKSDRKCRNF